VSELKQPSLFKEIVRLGKLRLGISVVFSSVAGYLLGYQVFSWFDLFMLSAGGVLVVAASNAFNQIYEVEQDSLMNRTKNRPLPAGTLSIAQAYTAAISAFLIGLFMLYSINVLSAFFGGISALLYAAVNTPLKARTSLAVFVGAFPGAIPYMLGWVAARNDFDIETGTCLLNSFSGSFLTFGRLHGFSFEDYQKAGYNLLPSGAKDRSTQLYIIVYTRLDDSRRYTACVRYHRRSYLKLCWCSPRVSVGTLGLRKWYSIIEKWR
jgi:protoheme IX farnesyltransferase